MPKNRYHWKWRWERGRSCPNGVSHWNRMPSLQMSCPCNNIRNWPQLDERNQLQRKSFQASFDASLLESLDGGHTAHLLASFTLNSFDLFSQGSFDGKRCYSHRAARRNKRYEGLHETQWNRNRFRIKKFKSKENFEIRKKDSTRKNAIGLAHTGKRK